MSSRTNRRTGIVVVALALACGGCGGPAEGDYVERGDLDDLRERGKLRILLPPQRARMLPRSGDLLGTDLRLARELGAELGLQPVLLTIESREALLQALLDGRGDLAIARLTATEQRRRRFGFSVPLDHVREVLVVREAERSVRTPADLAGRTVAVRASSSFHGTLVRLQETVPELRILQVDETLDTEELLYRVARGSLEATAADEDLVRSVMRYEPGVRIAFPLTGERPIAWALRPESERLKVAVDGFLQRSALTAHLDETLRGDLPRIRQRRVLRVLTRNNAATYFLHRGRQVGFEFELAERFAGRIGCRLQVVVPPTADRLIPWLRQGRGDLIAAALTVTPSRREEVAFSRPYERVHEVVVAPADDDTITTPADLRGRRVHVRRSSSYFDSLRRLQEEVPFEIVMVSEDEETESLIAAVGEGRIDLTVADRHLLDIELAWRDDVREAFVLSGPKSIAWAVRPEDTALLREVDAFLSEEYRGEFFNVLRSRYFRNPARVASLAGNRADREGRISPWDELFRSAGRQVEIDWRLLAAQAYAESGFDPEATSFAGAIGLMQVMPRTAREMGVDGDLRDPEHAIRAGSLYLRHLFDRFEPRLPLAVRLRFALGAYNAGAGHVQDARRLAREEGLDPDRWFGQVERVLPLLSRPAYAAASRYGYCRCRQTREYVRRVNDHYVAYARAVE